MQRFQKGTRTLFEGRLVLLISLVTNRLGSGMDLPVRWNAGLTVRTQALH